jgi:6-phosphofructokinase 1
MANRLDVCILGEPRFASRLGRESGGWITLPDSSGEPLEFERAGARAKLYFNPPSTRAAIVTCGGLCPGLNNVIRSLYFELYHRYGVREVLGIRYGYAGLDPAHGYEPIELDTALVENIHKHGGTILGTSRGPVDPATAVDFLESQNVRVLFCVGGDGTSRGAHRLHEEARRRGFALSVIAVPKTIDNDIQYVWRTFGYHTAIEQSVAVVDSAHNEARSVVNGIGLVKLMGRHAGFIAAGATLASQEVNFTIIPEVPLKLESFLPALKQRLEQRRHAVVVVAEGAGQEMLAAHATRTDASGNPVLADIGPFLRDRICDYMAHHGMDFSVKYLDPSYFIRSRPATCDDALLCDQLARNAVHAAMAGRSDVVIGLWYNVFIHVPIPVATSGKKVVPTDGELWSSVLATTGQPARWD